jgi:V8-like Glu-specific endopeptidase
MSRKSSESSQVRTEGKSYGYQKPQESATVEKSSESSQVRTEGKSYAYQKPQESATVDTSTLVTRKQKIVEAVDDFIDEFLARVGTPAGGGSGTGASGAGGLGSASGTGSASGRPSTGGSAGAGTSGAAGGTSTYAGGERPLGETGRGSGNETTMSVMQQRAAFEIDKARESARKARRRESQGASASADHGGPAILSVSTNKHLSDSNRAPVTESREFPPMFGTAGRPTTATMEKMAVPAARPETVPAIGTVSGRPLDAYFGSFGTAVERAAARAKVGCKELESVIGTDDRVRVTATTRYPWSCICSLLITANTGTLYIGTGWLVGPRLVLTAGHCVYMADENGWASSIEVIPGRNATDRPFGSAVSRELRSVTGWTRDNDSDLDYGAIVLPPDKRYGEQLGWFGYASRDDDYLKSITLNLSGYPGDGGKLGQQVDGSQWYNFRGVKEVMDRQISYEIDTYGGQSGAPVWEMRADGGRYGVGIHTWGTSVANGATRITRAVFDNIVLWAGQAS